MLAVVGFALQNLQIVDKYHGAAVVPADILPDIIANKGSYKSLIESLKWFEYGDIIKIKEIWKREDFGKIIYSDASINMVVSDRIKDMIQNFSKTTYISLSIAKQGIVKGSYDEELNPVLKQKNPKASL